MFSKITSSNVLFHPQPRNIQPTVGCSEVNKQTNNKKISFKKAESDNSDTRTQDLYFPLTELLFYINTDHWKLFLIFCIYIFVCTQTTLRKIKIRKRRNMCQERSGRHRAHKQTSPPSQNKTFIDINITLIGEVQQLSNKTCRKQTNQ